MTAAGFIISAPASGSGKTLLSLGLMAAFRRRGLAVAAAKVGPDYIDPAFHRAALARTGTNLDGWALTPSMLASRVARIGHQAELVICEGVMGLLDGADVPASGADGSTAQIAVLTGWPVVLVVDAARMAGTAAAIVHGLAHIRPDIAVTGVIFNRVASDRHRRMIARAGIPQEPVKCRPIRFRHYRITRPRNGSQRRLVAGPANFGIALHFLTPLPAHVRKSLVLVRQRVFRHPLDRCRVQVQQLLPRFRRDAMLTQHVRIGADLFGGRLYALG